MSRRHSLPAEVYALVDRTPATVLLESGKADGCTQLFTAPVRECMAHTAQELSQLFAEVENAISSGLTAAGYFTYECGNCFEPSARQRPARGGQPLAWFGIYERAFRFDHATGKFLDAPPPQLNTSTSAASSVVPVPLAAFALTQAEFAQRIAAIHELIRAGDVYQLNFTVPIELRVQGRIADLYARLQQRQPVDYGAFIHAQPQRRILSFSPELFFRVDQLSVDELSVYQANSARRIVTRPMKGTAARGRTTQEDRERAEWLRNDPKNRAENLMIVDLLRNDLGRLAKFGTVQAEDLFAVERFPTLWQMTSTVTAELRPEVGFHDIFRALFPCGSITGAPKVRAMQLLAELEAESRGVYTGAIGFFSPRQTVFNVAIRTIELDGERGTMGVGSGIVIDSDPGDEFRECQLKAEFLTGCVGKALFEVAPPSALQLIETLLWNGGYPLLEFHLDRLIDSAEYFAFLCNREQVRAALESHAAAFSGSSPRKVRLLLDAGGELAIADEALPPLSVADRIGRVRIAQVRTDSADRMLFHKTTQRPLYAAAWKEAARSGHDDMLFLNQRGEVTEGAISNLFIERDGLLLTPPVECGLLPGVYRRHLLETRPAIEQRILTLGDLRAASTIYIANAVRGLRRVQVDWNA